MLAYVNNYIFVVNLCAIGKKKEKKNDGLNLVPYSLYTQDNSHKLFHKSYFPISCFTHIATLSYIFHAVSSLCSYVVKRI